MGLPDGEYDLGELRVKKANDQVWSATRTLGKRPKLL
jgi:hypothetical protein